MNTESEKVVQQGAFGVPEASKFSGLGRTYLYSLMGRGELRFIKTGRRRLIPRAELCRLLGDRLVGPEKVAV